MAGITTGLSTGLSAGDVAPRACPSRDSCKEDSPLSKSEATLKGERTEFMSRLWRLVEEGDRFTDVKIVFKDGQQTGAHSVVLAALSPFFQAMLSTEMREKSRGVIKLPTISQSTFQRALCWSFGQEVRVRVGRSLRDLLEAADMMQLWALAGACVGVLVAKLTPDSCLDILNLVYRFKMNQVREQVEVYVGKYLGKACLSQGWSGLAQDEVARLVAVAVKEGTGADVVAEAVLKWLGSNTLDPPEVLHLLSMVQVEQLSSPFLCDNLMFHPSVLACSDFADIVKRNIRLRLTMSDDAPASKEPSTTAVDLRRGSQTVHFLHSQRHSTSSAMPPVSVSPSNGERVREQGVITTSSAFSRDILQVQSRHSEQPPIATIAPYREEQPHVRRNSARARGSLPSPALPQSPREEDMADDELETGDENEEEEEEDEEEQTPREGVLLVAGLGSGAEGRAMVKAWLLDEERWVSLADPPAKLSHGCASALQGSCLWVTGGRGSRKKAAMLDLRVNAWSPGPDLGVGRYAHAMAATQDHLYVVGGCAGFTLKSIERRSNVSHWQEWGNLQVPVQDCGVGVAGDLLVVLGGEGIERQFCFLQTFNLRTRAACIARSRLPVMTSAVRYAGNRVIEGENVLCFMGGDGHVVFVTDVRDNIRVIDHLQLDDFGPRLVDFGAVLDGDLLMVCGGFRSGTYHSDVRAYNMAGRRVHAALRHLPATVDVRAVVKVELPFLPHP